MRCTSKLNGRQCTRPAGHPVAKNVWVVAANTHEAGGARWTDEAADALESLSAPSGEDGLPERLEAQATFVPETRMADVMREAATALRAARRLSPVTREALEVEIYEAEARYDDMQSVGKPPGSVVPSFERFLADALVTWLSLPESAENPVVSAIEAAKAEVAAGRRASVVIDVPDPVTREALAVVADAIRQSCTPSFAAYQSGGDALIAAVADWTALRSLPEPAEVEWGLSDSTLDSFPKPHFTTKSEENARMNQRRGHPAIKLVNRTVSPWVPVKGTEQ